MNLKENYKNDKYTGKRQYLLTKNGDGTYSIDDVTVYLEIGDIFSADDINNVNREVNSLNRSVISIKAVKRIDISASGWTSSPPYKKIVPVSGLSEPDTPIVSIYIPDGSTAEQVKSMTKAYGCVDRAATGNGILTLYCYDTKPEHGFHISIKGE